MGEAEAAEADATTEAQQTDPPPGRPAEADRTVRAAPEGLRRVRAARR